MSDQPTLEDIELKLLLDGIYQYYGYDFRDYENTSLKRRIHLFMNNEQIETLSKLQGLVLHDPSFLEYFLQALSVNVTSLFRDTGFYLAIRNKVVPILRTYPSIKVWVAGCSTGEEAYSMAILLREAELHHKSIIYATDINKEALNKAKKGIFPLYKMQAYSENYLQAGGKKTLSKFCIRDGEYMIINSSLKKNIVFAQHNLVTDRCFNEFNFILCRNVLIYFNQDLQRHVHQLLYESLVMFGILALGNRESLLLSPVENRYQILDVSAKLYKKIR